MDSRTAGNPLWRGGRVGLQIKAVLVLTFVVVGVTVAGGWFYFRTARHWLYESDRSHALRMGEALSLAAQHDLGQGRNVPLQRLASDFLCNSNVRYVALLNAAGEVMASASREADPAAWTALTQIPATVWDVQHCPGEVLTLARPIVLTVSGEQAGKLVGAARLVLDGRSTAATLAQVQKRISAIAAMIVLCAIPLGYLLVWRVLVQPIRCLVAAARQLARSDFAARVGLRRNDEIGELSSAFDAMAEEIARSHSKLMGANEQLERTVAERTQELQAANVRLRAEMAEKEDFLRAVSHDLNAPLRNIAGMATMTILKWGQALPEEVRQRLQRIQANVDVESSLISELLELSRIRTRPQKREVVDMGRLLSELAATFEFDLRQAGIELRAARTMPRLYVEKIRIRQAFQNLIDNAIKYMHRPSGGLIEVSYCRRDGMHLFSVRDNGPGIPDQDHQRIFYVFRRSSNAADVEGKGVGLAVVKSVVANYDGRAWVQSQMGAGSTFFVSLCARCTEPPANEPTVAAGAAEATEEIPAGSFGG